jgi:acyl-CoA synthetase (AMP-forming)/AMP-acid ligase II
MQALIISPRNSSTAICHMLRTASSHRLIVTNSSLGSLVNDVQEEMSLLGHAIELQELPRLPDIYPHLAQESKSDAFQPVSPSAHVKSPNDIVLYLHSSGSTGLPKLIPTTNEVLSKMVYSSLVEPLKNVKRPYCASPACSSTSLLINRTVLAAPGLPGFHVGGIWMHLVYPLYSGRPSGILRPTFPLPPPVSSPAVILAALKSLKPTATLIMPSILESWAHDAEAVKYLKTIDEIVSDMVVATCLGLISPQRFGGSPLSTAIGDALVAQGCRLRSVYGCTEAAFITAQEAIDVTPNEWAWCEFGPNVDIRWRPAENGAFELQVLRSEKCITSVENLPDTRGYATQDLWVPHPTKPNAWKLYVSMLYPR